jgi:cohesin loading factor subunit SCC2
MFIFAVLPVLPLPTPLPSTLNNKSQLFHPRVAEEAAILLDTQDDNLVSLLIQSLMQTSVQHMYVYINALHTLTNRLLAHHKD